MGSDQPTDVPPPPPPSQWDVFRFWLPLAATWVMMAAEGPYLAAVIARLPDPTYNLAAYGVTLAFAFVIESPVVMLMTASTALAEDSERFKRLQTFAYALMTGVTLVLLVVLIPPVFDFLALRVVAVPDRVAQLTYWALWILLPWPAAIGYRRFYQGLLIRDGKTRLVAVGTVIRLVSMTGTGFLLFLLTDLPGAWVAASALSAGVTAEAIVSRWMARDSIREVRRRAPDPAAGGLDYPKIVRFYIPLALTSLIGFAVHPMLTFFMGRAPEPVTSLAVFPVVNSLAFLFRSMGLAFQETTIAMMGPRFRNIRPLHRFGWSLGSTTSLGLGLVALTPLAYVWFEVISGLDPELARFALLPTLLLVPIPFLSVFLSYFRGLLVLAHDTRPITIATILEVACIAAVFPLLTANFGVVGVTAAAGAFTAGRTASVVSLIPRAISAVRNTST